MIFTIPLTIFFAILSVLVSLLPDPGAISIALSTGASYVFGFLWNFNFILDVPTLIQIILLQFGFESAILLWHMIHWGIKKIPFLHVR